MWFLWFWLISIVVCSIVLGIIGLATAKKFKRECPNIKPQKKSFAELLCAFMPFLIPFINLFLLIFIMLQSDKIIVASIKKVKEENSKKEQ